MRIVVTCGPSYEPIDEVRRITNFSTGELGMLLANALAAAGHEVICFRGEGATTSVTAQGPLQHLFSTNNDLAAKLAAVPNPQSVDALFHVAALADYRVKSALDSTGQQLAQAKLSSRGGDLSLVLEPVPKVIGKLRGLFPNARIVGWKYEMDGTRTGVLEKATQQITANRTNACVLNGRAFGSGFGLVEPGKPLVEYADKPALVAALCAWLKG